MTDINVYGELLTDLENTAKELINEIEAYRGGDFKNKSSAARIRKATSTLGSVGKEFRKESVAFHK